MKFICFYDKEIFICKGDITEFTNNELKQKLKFINKNAKPFEGLKLIETLSKN